MLRIIFTLTYVKRYPYRDFRTVARKSRFLLQTGSADCQRVTIMWLCQESRETLIALQRGRYCIATEALLRCETAVTGVPGGPYGKKTG